ncbi:MAG: TylF/MycF family methyltransferase, partial [Betaproteobacteria bacterium]|nr:TylF/MycF family methyltransferase [Betaproteobacteria bacterium]
SAARSLFAAPARDAVEYPLETEDRLNRAHARAPVDQHLRILFEAVEIGGENFVDLFTRCLQHTGTAVTPFNVFQRFQTRHLLTQYFLETLSVPGARAECGAYRGATGLLLCHAWRSRDPHFRGGDFFLIDSFSGTSRAVAQDLIPVRGEDGATRMEPFFPAGKTDATPEMVRRFFSDYPDARICPGWIPEVFSMLPDRQWAFVHLDITIFEPTLAALEYFYPRLASGGVILCDGSVFCPGAERAWSQFCTQRDIPYVMLGHRESVLIKP